MKTIGFIGGGNMAQALLEGILKAGLFKKDRVWVSDVRSERLDELKAQYGIQVTSDNTELTAQADIIVLSVKPQVMAVVLDGITGTLKNGVLIISIAAGITTASIRAKLGDVQIIRVMPNTPALVGAGASGLYNAGASDDGLKIALNICSSVGKAIVVENEDLIDTVNEGDRITVDNGLINLLVLEKQRAHMRCRVIDGGLLLLLPLLLQLAY